MQKLLTLAAVAALMPCAALAEGMVNGAEVGLSYSSLADGGARDAHKTALDGALEYGFSPNFAAELDVSQSYFGDDDLDGTALTGHAIYHGNGGLALGAYAGHEWIDDDGAAHYGVEAAKDFGQMTVQGQFGKIDAGAQLITSYELGAQTALNDQLTLGASYQGLEMRSRDLVRADATLDYALPSGVKLSGSLGVMDGDGMDAEATFGLGVHATFGGKGATFGQRGLLAFMPGY